MHVLDLLLGFHQFHIYATTFLILATSQMNGGMKEFPLGDILPAEIKMGNSFC